MAKFVITEEMIQEMEYFYEPFNVECMLMSIEYMEEVFLESQDDDADELKKILTALLHLREIRKHLQSMVNSEGGEA